MSCCGHPVMVEEHCTTVMRTEVSRVSMLQSQTNLPRPGGSVRHLTTLYSYITSVCPSPATHIINLQTIHPVLPLLVLILNYCCFKWWSTTRILHHWGGVWEPAAASKYESVPACSQMNSFGKCAQHWVGADSSPAIDIALSSRVYIFEIWYNTTNLKYKFVLNNFLKKSSFNHTRHVW